MFSAKYFKSSSTGLFSVHFFLNNEWVCGGSAECYYYEEAFAFAERIAKQKGFRLEMFSKG